MRSVIRASVCPVRYCGRLVCAALPLTVTPAFQFDTKTYCSPRCAELHSRGDHRTPTGPLISCDICCDDKPLTEYIHKIRERGIVTEEWDLRVPPGCLPHLAPELLNMEGGTCNDCLQAHILTQLETRGAINISCIRSHPTLESPEGFYYTSEQLRLAKSQEWIPYAHHFIPQDLHDMFNQQLFDYFIHTTTATVWTCPSVCGFGDGILQFNDIPGFPHVECPGCREHFCANCKAPWHDKQTCQEYRALHPELRDKDEVKHLHELARLGARRCPRCQFIIVKDGGCDHVHCEQCRFDFVFPKAERVVAPPPEFMPASASSASSSSFKGWGMLRQAQEEHINRNRIADTPFNISSATTQHEEGVFYYDHETDLWSPEICELDEIAGLASGRRYVRQPRRDKDGFWAFIAVEGGERGEVTLHEALVSELFHVPFQEHLPMLTINDGFNHAHQIGRHFMDMVNEQFAPPADQAAGGAEWVRFDTVVQGDHVGNPDSAAAQQDDAGTNNIHDGNAWEEAANDRRPPAPFAPTWDPPRDAIDALIDQMLFSAMQPGVGHVTFGFGVGMPPMHLFEGVEEDDGPQSL